MLLRQCLLIICGLLVVIWPSKAEKDKLWEKDMSQEVYIEASVEGLKGRVIRTEHRVVQYDFDAILLDIIDFFFNFDNYLIRNFLMHQIKYP